MGQKSVAKVPNSVNGSKDPDLEASGFTIFNRKPMGQI